LLELFVCVCFVCVCVRGCQQNQGGVVESRARLAASFDDDRRSRAREKRARPCKSAAQKKPIDR
jgi:hypothetical protein